MNEEKNIPRSINDRSFSGKEKFAILLSMFSEYVATILGRVETNATGFVPFEPRGNVTARVGGTLSAEEHDRRLNRALNTKIPH